MHICKAAGCFPPHPTHQHALGLSPVLGLTKHEGGLEHAAAELVLAPLEVLAPSIPGHRKQLAPGLGAFLCSIT